MDNLCNVVIDLIAPGERGREREREREREGEDKI
jgi:hypothetical protein